MEESPNNAPWSARLPRLSPARAFATVFFAVFLFVFLTSALVTFLLPETFAAAAHVVAPDPAQLQFFQSAELLKQVSQQLHLARTLPARYGEDQPWDDPRVEDWLRRLVQVRRVRGTKLIDIRVQGPSPLECAQLANEIAETGASHAWPGLERIEIVDKAVPPLRPFRPNKPLNLVLGALVGIFLGTMAGGVGAKLAVGFDGQPAKRT